MAICEIELMELFEATVGSVQESGGEVAGAENKGVENKGGAWSYFQAPSDELRSGGVSLDRVLAGHPTMMSALAEAMSEAGDCAMAVAMRDIEQFWATACEQEPDHAARPKLLDFVYPVV